MFSDVFCGKGKRGFLEIACKRPRKKEMPQKAATLKAANEIRALISEVLKSADTVARQDAALRTLTLLRAERGVEQIDASALSHDDVLHEILSLLKYSKSSHNHAQSQMHKKSVEWDVRFGEGNFVNGCKEYVELLHTPVSQSSISSSQPNSTSQNPLSDDSYIYCAFSQECRVPKRTMAVQWPLGPISDNELNLASLLKHATILEANVLKIIMEKDTFLQTTFATPDTCIRRSKMPEDDVQLLVQQSSNASRYQKSRSLLCLGWWLTLPH